MARQLYIQRLQQELVFSLLRQKWTVQIVRKLETSHRFSALQRELSMSSKTLSKRLSELTGHGLLTKAIYAEVPVRVEYELTPKGRELLAIIHAIDTWEKKWA